MKKPTPEFVLAAVEIVINGFETPLTLGDLAKAARLPQNTLTRYFNAEYGLSPVRWLWVFRVFVAARFIMLQPAWSMGEVSERCGFNSMAHFSRRFREVIGLCPTEFRSLLLHSGIPARLPTTSEYREFNQVHYDALRAAVDRIRAMPYYPRDSIITICEYKAP